MRSIPDERERKFDPESSTYIWPSNFRLQAIFIADSCERGLLLVEVVQSSVNLSCLYIRLVGLEQTAV
jgi:hypothetical protein